MDMFDVKGGLDRRDGKFNFKMPDSKIDMNLFGYQANSDMRNITVLGVQGSSETRMRYWRF
jgi:hypothetical protein